eukprot:1446825-Rhodomonas_salina.3
MLLPGEMLKTIFFVLRGQLVIQYATGTNHLCACNATSSTDVACGATRHFSRALGDCWRRVAS